MFINFWYVACESSDLQDTPRHARMLGHDFVLFRDSTGATHCLANICAHRGASLAHGKVKGDCVECPYHGWRYDGEGRCQRIPSLTRDAKIPARARVDSYPVEERYGLVFTFLGDLPESERPPILEVAEWGDPTWRRTCSTLDWKLNFRRSMENAMDGAHNEFVHTTHLPERDDDWHWPVPERELTETEWGVVSSAARVTGKPLPNAEMREASTMATPGDVEVQGGVVGVSSFRTYIDLKPEAKFHQYFYETPIDEENTRVFALMMRNFMLEPEHDALMSERNEFVAGEDQAVVETIRPLQSPDGTSSEVLVPSDGAIPVYRRKLSEWRQRGWEIDSAEIRRAGANVAYAIPSPARRESKGWLLNSVPLISPTSKQ